MPGRMYAFRMALSVAHEEQTEAKEGRYLDSGRLVPSLESTNIYMRNSLPSVLRKSFGLRPKPNNSEPVPRYSTGGQRTPKYTDAMMSTP